MSDPTLAKKDPATVLAEALALYKLQTGITLAPADPRRLHLQTLLLFLAQQRELIDFSGKQSLLRFVSDEWIDELAALWGEVRLPALSSQCTQRFNYATIEPHTVAAGVRVTDGTNIWRVLEDFSSTADYLEVLVECDTLGSATNGIAIGQIDTLVDPDELPGCLSTANTTETSKGRAIESLEDFRERLRGEPEARSTCGPRNAYKAAALEASSTVADAMVLGPNDALYVVSYSPNAGEVFVIILKGERDDDGVLTSVVPDPDSGLIAEVLAALSAEDVRPLTDLVFVLEPIWEDFDCVATYYIARSRVASAASIEVAVQEAFDAYLLWQQSKIGRDINPSELTARLVNAGAKRVAVTEPAFAELKRDQSARCTYQLLVYGGVEDD